MEQFLNGLLSPVWWITVVVGTIVLHVFAIRVDAAIPRAMDAISRKRLKTAKVRRELSEARINLMRAEPITIHYFVHQANFNHHQATLWLIVALTIIFIVVNYLDPLIFQSAYKSIMLAAIYIIIALCFLLHLSTHFAAFEIGRDIRAALMMSTKGDH